MSRHILRFTLNREPVELEVEASWTLATVLRDHLGATGTKLGCEVGVCGACSVLVDGVLLSGCLLPALFVDNKVVQTIEGLESEDGQLTPLQNAFIEHGGFQCGICTPGQVVAATALLTEVPRPTPEQIRDWMMGNLCRCTGYYGIIRAIEAASSEMEAK